MSIISNVCDWIILNAGEGVRRRVQLAANRHALERLYREVNDFEALSSLTSSGRLRRAIRPVLTDAPRGNRVLVLAPHQDDETIGSGGTLIRCVRLGKKVKTIYLTSGKPANKATSQDAAIREEEARAAWKLIGGEEPEFWRLPCRELPVTQESALRLRKTIGDYGADCVFVPHFLEPPMDHRRTAQLLAMAHKLEALPGSMEVWSYQVSAMHCPNVVVDITDIVEEKDAVNRLWVSQNHFFNYAHFSRGMAAYNSIYLDKGGKEEPQKRYAEIFFLANPSDYCGIVQVLLTNEDQSADGARSTVASG